MSFAVYILRCADNSYYTGHTDNLEQRIAQHQSGAIRGYTFERRPIELVWADHVATREEALLAEMRIKRWSRAKKEAWIAKDWNRLSKAAMPPSEREERTSASLGLVPRLRSGRTERAVLDPPPPPIIILVRPQLGQNIGKAARAMLNFGLTELRLVAPRDGWPNPEAGPAASGADVVLEQAKLFDSVAEAIADCSHVYATTVRKRGVERPVMTPEEAARTIHADLGRSAILFGPERSGLETDDLGLARTIITVPINPAFGSLNLAQAVILCAYEWSKGVGLDSPPATLLDPPATQEELDGLITHLDLMLDGAGYFFPAKRAPAFRRALRGVLTKPGWSSQEVRTLRGVLSTLERPHERG